MIFAKRIGLTVGTFVMVYNLALYVICGITTMDAKGYYSDTAKTVVYIILNRFQIRQMREIVREVDPNAYISIAEIANVFGGKSNAAPKK